DPHQAHRLRDVDRQRLARGSVPHRDPAGRALGRARIHRPRVRHLRDGRHGQPSRHRDRRDPARRGRELHRDLLRSVVGAGGVVRLPAAHAGVPAGGHPRAVSMRSWLFTLLAIAAGAALFAASRFIQNDYFFFAGYVVLQYIVLSTAWNILGGYCGYVNFGTAALFAIGAYSSVAIHKLLVTSRIYPVSIPELIIIGGVVSAIVGLGIGYLTLRLRGAFFSIATLALAVVIQTLITNWDYVGGSRGAYVVRPAVAPLVGSYIQYLFLVMLVLAILAVFAARMI